MSKKAIKVVELQIDRGEAKYDQYGNYTGERQTVTLTYGDTQWESHVRNLPFLGITNVEVVGAYGHTQKQESDHPDSEYTNQSIDVSDDLRDEVARLFKRDVAKEKSPEQKQIDELKEQLAALTKGKVAANKEGEDAGEITGLREQFKAKFDREVPNAQKNNVEWIKGKLAE